MGKNQSKPEGQDQDGQYDSQTDGIKRPSLEKQYSLSPKSPNSKREESKTEDVLSPTFSPKSGGLYKRTNSAMKNSQSPDAATGNSYQNLDDMMSHPVYENHGERVYQIHAYLENIYQCTFYKESWEKRSGLRLLQNEQDKKEEILLFTLENFEDVIQKILESTVYFQSDEKLIFLHNVYTRLCNSSGNNLISAEQKTEMKQVSMSYLTSYLISPEVFSSDITPENPKNYTDFSCTLYDMFYTQITNTGRDTFIKGLVSNLSEDDYEAVLVPIFKRICRECADTAIENVSKLTKSMELLENILESDKKAVNFFVNHDLFLPKVNTAMLNGAYLQKMTVFGAFLSVSAYPNESKVVRTYFSERNNIKNSEEIVNMLRNRMHSIVDHVHRLMEYIMKSDPKYKRNILDWLYTGLSVNEAKQKTFNFGSLVSSEGWFTNFVLLLIKFSQKMLDDINRYPNWFGKIDLNFLKQKQIFNNIVLINGKTNIYIPSQLKEDDKKESESNGDNEVKGQSDKYTFLSELVFMVNHAVYLHNPTNKSFIELLQKLQKQHTNSGPSSRNFLSSYSKKLAYDIQAADPQLLTYIYKLLVFDILLIMYTFGAPVTKHDDTSQLFENIKSSQWKDPTTQETSLPIYWTENIQECMIFLRQIGPSILSKTPKNFEIVMNFLLMGISNDSIITNPHLKAKYLQILSSLVPQKEPLPNSKEEDFSFLFEKNQYFKDHLIKNLFQFFLEVERTCSNGQFYEKFSYRYGCCVIIGFLLKKMFPNDRNSFVATSLNQIAKESPELYLQFWTICLDDILALLDDVIEKMHEIKSFQQETENNHILLIFSFHDRHERAIMHEQNKKLIQTFLSFINGYYNMLSAAIKVSPDFFLKEEIKEKLIVTLNYSIQQLMGKNPKKLKMKAMRELKFDPKLILENITQIYLNFQYDDEFLTGMVNDERCFGTDIFKKLAKTLRKHVAMSEPELAKFSVLQDELTKRVKTKHDEDEFIAGLKDIPEEFIDPIMNHIMKDPVLLPTSNTIVDRMTINKHLSTDETDPFNRNKLTKDMLVPQGDLRKRIEEFFKDKKNTMKRGI